MQRLAVDPREGVQLEDPWLASHRLGDRALHGLARLDTAHARLCIERGTASRVIKLHGRDIVGDGIGCDNAHHRNNAMHLDINV